MRWKEFPPRVPPHPHRDGATARTYNTPRTVIVWALSTSSLKHKAGLFRGNHSMAPCLGSPCLVSARTSRSPDKAAHSLDRWPDSYVTFLNFWLVSGFLIQEVKCFSRGGESVCTGPASVSSQTGIPCRGCYASRSPQPKLQYPLREFSFKHILAHNVLSVGSAQRLGQLRQTEPALIFRWVL